MRVLFIFLVLVASTVAGAYGMYDVRFENGQVNLYEKGGYPMPTGGTFMVIAGPARQPSGHYDQCLRSAADCNVVANDPRPTALTNARWTELIEVNDYVNRTVRPHPKDKDGRSTDLLVYGVNDYWTCPDSGYGDCEDIVCAKRRALIKHGWPASSLLTTLVYLPDGGKHAVLTVRTDRGDFILDNLEKRIVAWNVANLQFYKRQSEFRSDQWREVIDPRYPAVAATN